MAVVLAENSYGKSRVRMIKVERGGNGRPDRVREVSVAIALEGDFAAAHTLGDNSAVLPTDTMKNTVYALGRDHPIATIESFAVDLARHFIASHTPAIKARVSIAERPWEPVMAQGRPHPSTFCRAGEETRTCAASISRDGAETLESGLDGLVLLKTRGSGFEGYPRDRFTTLKETADRLLGTRVGAAWALSSATGDCSAARQAIREALIATFAGHESKSVQHTLYAMAETALAAAPAAAWIRLSLPNLHCLPVDLSAFGLGNPGEIFLPIDEPHGLIEATVRRLGA